MSDELVVYIIDDDIDLLENVKTFLQSHNFRVHTFEQAIHFYGTYRIDKPGCILLDLRMPNMTGHDVVRWLEERDYHHPVIIMSAYSDTTNTVKLMKLGAVDVIEKPFQFEELHRRIQDVIDEDAPNHQRAIKRMELLVRYEQLSQRERQVMQLVVQGLSNKQIARELGLSIKTIESHRAKMMTKMNAPNMAKLVRDGLTLFGDDGHGKHAAS